MSCSRTTANVLPLSQLHGSNLDVAVDNRGRAVVQILDRLAGLLEDAGNLADRQVLVRLPARDHELGHVAVWMHKGGQVLLGCEGGGGTGTGSFALQKW